MGRRFVALTFLHKFIYRTVKFWDLETFDLVSSSDAEQSSVR